MLALESANRAGAAGTTQDVQNIVNALAAERTASMAGEAHRMNMAKGGLDIVKGTRELESYRPFEFEGQMYNLPAEVGVQLKLADAREKRAIIAHELDIKAKMLGMDLDRLKLQVERETIPQRRAILATQYENIQLEQIKTLKEIESIGREKPLTLPEKIRFDTEAQQAFYTKAEAGESQTLNAWRDVPQWAKERVSKTMEVEVAKERASDKTEKPWRSKVRQYVSLNGQTYAVTPDEYLGIYEYEKRGYIDNQIEKLLLDSRKR